MDASNLLIEKLISEYAVKPKNIKIWAMDGNAKATKLNGHPKFFCSLNAPDEYIWLDYVYPDLKLDGIHFAKSTINPSSNGHLVSLNETYYDVSTKERMQFSMEIEVTPETYCVTRFWVEPEQWINCQMHHPRELIRSQTHQFKDIINDPKGDIEYSRFLLYESRILLHINDAAPVSTSKLMTISQNLNTGAHEYTETLLKLTNGMPAYFSKFLGPDAPGYDRLMNSPTFEFDEVEYRMQYESFPLREFEL